MYNFKPFDSYLQIEHQKRLSHPTETVDISIEK